MVYNILKKIRLLLSRKPRREGFTLATRIEVQLERKNGTIVKVE